MSWFESTSACEPRCRAQHRYEPKLHCKPLPQLSPSSQTHPAAFCTPTQSDFFPSGTSSIPFNVTLSWTLQA
ncbi:hypothetical protein K439DRAFT_1638035 [Ramaria rubella]|nr:hypothetical protein K439DRAFT_1639794 [Ramaria rubella]KAF8579402.1 hypothetical protein K439DRAFT_1638035 [Ramaria rubella]